MRIAAQFIICQRECLIPVIKAKGLIGFISVRPFGFLLRLSVRIVVIDLYSVVVKDDFFHKRSDELFRALSDSVAQEL